MKGYLQKTEEGWFVLYDQRTMQDPSAEDGVLPLHPKYASYFNMHLTSTTFLNKEVEFEEEALVDKLDCYQNCVFKTYAKLIEKTDVEKLAEEVYGNNVNPDYEEGFVDGYNKAKETLYTEEQVVQSMLKISEYIIDALERRYLIDTNEKAKDIIKSLKINKL